MDRVAAQGGQGGSSKSQGTSAKPQGISDQITALRGDLSGLATTVSSLAKDQIGETATDLQGAAADKTQDLKAAIRGNPMQAAAIAAGVGFVLGLVLTR